jgi:SSS family solute:Na+ symporter
MQWLDVVVLVGYFALMIVIGAICARYTNKQEEFFMGGRSFGKLLQTFAAFGAGTGSNDPIQVGRTTWTSGLSGIWSVLMWLFCTPFYWIFGVWYRRMRCLTTGDFFAERYDSEGLAAAYALFGLAFYIMYLSAMFSAIAKVATPLIGFDTLENLGVAPETLKFYLVPTICVIVVLYGIVGGLRAAYWTDLIQGMCIIFLSIILIPAGLNRLAADGGGENASTLDGFTVMHDRMTEDYFTIIGGPRSGEFPLHYILSLSVLVLVGIVVQPHFIATGGGTAKSELAARTGLVTGNFLKRFCTIGWALTALIALAALAGNQRIEGDPDFVWGVASLELLGPFRLGLVGLMLACLLAALMSSADAYMLVSSALVTRNVYAAYVDPDASEQRYVTVGRITGLIIILGAALSALSFYDVFEQFLMAIKLPIIFAAPFWIGMYWRRGTRGAAWTTVACSTLIFFVLPALLPALMPELRTNPALTSTNHKVVTVVSREAKYVDVKRREAARANWRTKYDEALRIEDASDRQTAIDGLGPQPAAIDIGQRIDDTYPTGGKPVFWSGNATALGKETLERIGGAQVERGDNRRSEVTRSRRVGSMECSGLLQVDFLIYHWIGVPLEAMSDSMLKTMELPTRIVIPFLVMILISWITPRDDHRRLDRFYVKMKTPVLPDPEEDAKEMERSYEDPTRFDKKKLFPGTQIEIQNPTFADALGFIICFAICFLFIAFAMWVASIGG